MSVNARLICALCIELLPHFFLYLLTYSYFVHCFCRQGGMLSRMELLLGVLGNEGCRYFTQTEIDSMSTSKSSQSRVNHDDDDDEARWRRTLRTYVRNTFRFHQQTIYDIVDHNYRDWDDDESSQGSPFSRDTDRSSVQPQQQQLLLLVLLYNYYVPTQRGVGADQELLARQCSRLAPIS